MAYLDLLENLYRQAPCQVLPNPLWKTRQALERGGFDCTAERRGETVICLTARNAATLLAHWTRDRQAPVPAASLEGVTLALLHQDHTNAELRARFDHQTPYFRLLHAGAPDAGAGLPPGFSFAPVVLPAETAAVAELIGRCYPDLHPAPETVAGWTRHPVFAPDLWVWIVDRATGAPAALGLAELDTRLGEGALEWIQVLPAYRGQGLGTALVRELLRRLHPTAQFVTVSGRVDNATRPEALYRRCGFRGADIWWALRRP